MKKLLIRSTVLLAFAGLAIGAGGCTVESAPPASPVVRERVVAEPVPTRPVMVYYEGRWVRPWRGYRYREGEPLMVYRAGRWYRVPRGYRRVDWGWRRAPRRYDEPGRRYAEPGRRGERYERRDEPRRHAEPGRRARPHVRSAVVPHAEKSASGHKATTRGHRKAPKVRSAKSPSAAHGSMERRAKPGVVAGTAPGVKKPGTAQPPSKRHDSKHSDSPGHSEHHHEGGDSSQSGQ